MKKIFFVSFAAVALMMSSAFAQELGSSASLKQNMKQLGTLFKAIGSSVADSSQNSKNLEKSQQMTVLFKIVAQQVPETIADLPDGEKEAALKDYQDLMSQEVALSEQLQQAFANNDNAMAAKILQHMGDIRKNGHGKYKE
ncbi:cytochrome b562 [Bdellovibrio sp. NC01]|uniref:cytochrome b562 n=1 Tax=Bdellovibrio sp. NC01 TaxID=2220073 RepID=UPI00115A2A2A|nr:cytochrome b562 [Bdellovibrio sp. NC01]QDK38129.1 hypothetical protein DOE51_11300 [Bdellovibrio sp. NC01]